MTDDRLQ